MNSSENFSFEKNKNNLNKIIQAMQMLLNYFSEIFSKKVIFQCDSENIDFLKAQSFIETLQELDIYSFTDLMEIANNLSKVQPASINLFNLLGTFYSESEKNYFNYITDFTENYDAIHWITDHIALFEKTLQNGHTVYLGPLASISGKEADAQGKFEKKDDIICEGVEDLSYITKANIPSDISSPYKENEEFPDDDYITAGGYYILIPEDKKEIITESFLQDVWKSIGKKRSLETKENQKEIFSIKAYIDKGIQNVSWVKNESTIPSFHFKKTPEENIYDNNEDNEIQIFLKEIEEAMLDGALIRLKKAGKNIEISTLNKEKKLKTSILIQAISTVPMTSKKIKKILTRELPKNT